MHILSKKKKKGVMHNQPLLLGKTGKPCNKVVGSELCS